MYSKLPALEVPAARLSLIVSSPPISRPFWLTVSSLPFSSTSNHLYNIYFPFVIVVLDILSFYIVHSFHPRRLRPLGSSSEYG